jgi:hypothetical protein
MSTSITSAQPGAGVCVGITLTPADVNIIARAIRSQLASEWAEILAVPVPGREDILRIRTILEVYEGQIETLEGGDSRADIEMECPTAQVDAVTSDLLDRPEERNQDHRVAVCAMLQHLLSELHGKLEV